MVNYKDLITPSLTLKEFKTILGRYDINERDRDRLSAWLEKSNRTLDAASKIGNIDFTPFMHDTIIHEGGHNTIDFSEHSDFKSINDRFVTSAYASEPSVDYKEPIRKTLKDILTAYYINMYAFIETHEGGELINSLNNDISCIATFAYAELLHNYISRFTGAGFGANILRTLKSFCNFDVGSGRNKAMIFRGIDVNALFYLTKDVSIGENPVGGGEAPINMISNYLIHAHICFKPNFITNIGPTLESYIKEGEIPDEIVDNIKFLSYIEVSRLTKPIQIPIVLSVSDDELFPEQITAINEHVAVFEHPVTGGTIIPWGYENANPDVHEIASAKIYLPSDSGYKQVTITNNKITEIIEA